MSDDDFFLSQLQIVFPDVESLDEFIHELEDTIDDDFVIGLGLLPVYHPEYPSEVVNFVIN
jgi:hypothetical protein